MPIRKSTELKLLEFIKTEMTQDLAHDISHVLRVVKTAKNLCSQEHANEKIVVPAAYLHDCFNFEKNHPNRSQSSVFAAKKAVSFLEQLSYPDQFLDDIYHAIEAHSYSANIKARTLEAQIIQDADRLDALGAVGIARCFQVSAKLGRPLYSDNDAFCAVRTPDDDRFTIDHFYTKLLSLENSMNTVSAKHEARIRTEFMHNYLKQLETEVAK